MGTRSSSAEVPDIDFTKIRAYGQPASRSNGFEELASILICKGVIEWPEGVRFDRFGNPDGGREGRGVLPNGDVWAWQTKYLFSFDDAAIAQIKSSVERTFETEPKLARYYIALPIDLPAGDTVGPKRTLKSAQTRWEENKLEWVRAARSIGLNVEFYFIGAHQLVTALTESRHAGRARYWFDSSLLTPELQLRRLEEVIAKAGRRYTPKLHIDVDPVRDFDGLGRTGSYIRRWQDVLASLRANREYGWRAPAGDESHFEDLLTECGRSLDAVDLALVSAITASRSVGKIPKATENLEESYALLGNLLGVLRERHLQDGNYYVGDAASLHRSASETQIALRSGIELIESNATAAAQERRLLLTGRAGVGKTHLICDVASKRLQHGRPTVVVLGQDFSGSSLLSQIGEIAEIEGSLDDILLLLDAAGEAAGCIGLLMIDALNEGERPERWENDLRALLVKVSRLSHVAIAVSCRTEFVGHVVGEGSDIPKVVHAGFAEATSEAVDRYAAEYQIERPTFPILNPEFGNPLFLKLACEAIATLGKGRIQLGSAGLVTVCIAFLEAVNKRLASPGRCDYDETQNLILEVAQNLVLLGSGPYERAEVQRISDALLPGRSWSKSLLHGLLREGVLVSTFGGGLTFGYQRLGDVLRGLAVAGDSSSDIQDWVAGIGAEPWREMGVMSALSVIAPERYDVEFFDLLPDSDDGLVPAHLVDAFLQSVILRAPEHVTARAVEIINALLDIDDWPRSEAWDVVLRVSCVPGHPLSAEWLHGRLSMLSVADRDVAWSEWLVGSASEATESPVALLLKWSWPERRPDDSFDRTLPDDVARCATMALGWLLTATDRRVRDRATKALVSIADRSPAGFASGIQQFCGCNDPYVLERIAAACCGAALRTGDANSLRAYADAAVVLVGESWPAHLLTRDYLRRVAASARQCGWRGPEWRPPYDTTWPDKKLSREQVESLVGDPDNQYSSIWRSLTGYGDFGRYIIESALRSVHVDDRRKLQSDVETDVFNRCLDLGWTPEKFASLDRGRRGGNDGKVERYGKKYQWIGFYEALGRIADCYEIGQKWSGNSATIYEHPEQLVWRDIDPTVLVQPVAASAGRSPWFAPADISYSESVIEEFPRDLDDIPDPLSLISILDPQGSAWLSLMVHTSWSQELPPEISALRKPNLNAWIQIRSYLTPSSGVDALREWAKGKDWDGRWMPEHGEFHNVLLGAHPDSPDWEDVDGVDRSRFEESEVPVDLRQCVAWYGGTGTSRDSSGLEEPTGFVPTRLMMGLLGLSRGADFSWSNSSGAAIINPSHYVQEPHTCLLRRELSQLLSESGMTIFWTVLLNKQLLQHDYSGLGEDYRWISASTSYILNDGVIENIDAVATRRKPGMYGGEEEPIHWNVRREE